jgi:hypothetical protein
MPVMSRPSNTIFPAVAGRLAQGRIRRGGGRARGPAEAAVKVAQPADDALAQEADEEHEHHAERELPGRAELQRALQEVLQEQPDRGADHRPEKRAAPAYGGLHDQLPRGVEHECVGWHEPLQHAEQPSGQAGVGRCDH